MSDSELALRLFLQLAVLLAACRLLGLALRQVGQPQVIGEILAGIVLGPSLLGLWAPEAQGQLFPQASIRVIHVISQLGLVLYMFLTGLDFQWDLIRTRLRSASSVSLAGILAPFVIGSLLAVWLMRDPRFFPGTISAFEGMLFLGAAMSITALPVLARILADRGLTRTPLGTLALAAGSIDDAAAWCILALVVAVSSGDSAIVIIAVGGGALYAFGVLAVGRPLLRQFGSRAERNQGVSGAMFSLVLILLLLAAWFTNAIGIYEVFGAFLLGLAMPRGIFARELRRHLEPLTMNLLLPLFFIYSGLNTRIGLLDSPFLWAVTLLILLSACLGKGAACWLAARLHGEGPRNALALGTLMNTRGLMELILLNIGRERGIITPTLFTIMVLMAVATTLMATPLLDLLQRRPPQNTALQERSAALATAQSSVAQD
jgi:Kef-type K+ transport system membrane component KefB